jgi:hypothetical protein
MLVNGKLVHGMLLHGMLVNGKLVHGMLVNGMAINAMLFFARLTRFSIAMPFLGLSVPRDQPGRADGGTGAEGACDNVARLAAYHAITAPKEHVVPPTTLSTV